MKTQKLKGIVRFKEWVKTRDLGRLIGCIVYGFLGFVTIIVLAALDYYGKADFFYDQASNNFSDGKRLLWCLAFSFIGFAAIAYRASKGQYKRGDEAWRYYPTTYLTILILISSLVFSFYHIFNETRNYLFYYISAPTCFILGYFSDRAPQIAEKIISKPFS